MKNRILILAAALAFATIAHAATNNLTGLLQQGLFEEEANRNLDAAISNYQTLANSFDKDRQVAATAIFRLGECYRKLGKTNEAAAQYQRIVREFGDQQTLVTLSRQNLAGMGVAPQNASEQTAGQNPVLSQLKAQHEAEELRDRYDRLRGMDKAQLRIEIAQNFPNPVLTKLMQEEADARQDLVRFKADYGVNHPKYVGATDVVDTIDKQIDDQVQVVMEGLQARVNEAFLNAKSLQNQTSPPQLAANAQTPNEQAPVTDEEEKEIRRIQLMIQNSPDLINVGSLGPNGNWTPLYQAARSGWLRVATFLLDHGANVDADSGSEGKPLYAAAQFGNDAMVALLLSRGADVNARSESRKTALDVAAEKGFAAVTETLLNHKADVNVRDFNQRTPLHLAARAGQVETMRLLMAHGADLNAKDSQGYPPLLDALFGGYQRRVAAVETLLAAKPDVNVVFVGGGTVLGSAAAQGNDDTVKSLLEAKADPNGGTQDLPLTTAIEYGSSGSRSNICWMLLQAGADPNRADPTPLSNPGGGYSAGTDKVSLSPIQRAVILGQADIVKMLLDHNADANAPGFYHKTLLLEAVGGSRNEIAEALLTHGADANARERDDQTPLFSATALDNIKIVEALLTHGADANALGGGGLTPLIWATGQGESNIVEALLAHGADVNAHSGSEATTALHTAVQKGNRELAEVLIANKADVNALDAHGKTALDYAKEMVQQESPGAPGLPGLHGFPRSPLSRLPLVNPGAAAGPSRVSSSPEDVITLLRQHGALDELPNFSAIRVTRQGMPHSVVFEQPTNDWNQVTLFDLLGVQYQLVKTYTGDNIDHEWHQYGNDSQKNAFPFPDLARIVIHRPSADGARSKDLKIDVGEPLAAGNCAADVPLQFGDVVDIPEADHVIGALWTGLSTNELLNLSKCLTRRIQVTVKGQTSTITLAPRFNIQQTSTLTGGWKVEVSYVYQHFMLWPALRESNLLLSSSDLSRIKVTRRDPVTGKTHEWTVDCSNSQSPPNFWLRDGDVIDVPEKAGE